MTKQEFMFELLTNEDFRVGFLCQNRADFFRANRGYFTKDDLQITDLVRALRINYPVTGLKEAVDVAREFIAEFVN